MQRFLEWHANDFMTRNVVTVPPQFTLNQLEALFRQHDFNVFPVVENERVLGVVTKFDFLKAFIFTPNQVVPRYSEIMERSVHDVMTLDIVHVHPEAPLTKVLELMVERRARSFPVMNADGKLVGMISREDLIRALHQATGPEI